MLMMPPTGGDSFEGNDGFTYAAATGVTIEIGAGGIQEANVRGWIEQSYAGPVVILAPTTGFAYVINTGTTELILTPAGTLATGTLTMPASPADNAVVRITSSQTVTALTVNANAGQSIAGAPTSISASTPVDYFYNVATATWYRR